MDPKTIFVIAVTTARMIMPGMPAMQKIPGMKMPDLSAPKRTMTMTLTSDQKADKKSKAECAVPDGLKIGPKAVLDIALPQKSDEDIPDFGESSDTPGKSIDFTMKMYWKSSEVVLKGQPKVISSKDISADMKRAMEKDPRALKSMQQGFDAQSGSHAYWPGHNAKDISEDSTCPGSYELDTNYCGNTSITFDKPQDFLAAIDLTSPGKNADLAESIKVTWKSIPNAKAYLVNAMGSKDKLMVIWTSATQPDVKLDITSGAIPADKLAKYIEDGALLPADVTSCDIPIAIFNEVGNAMLTVTAFGADKIQTKDGIETQVVIRSTAMSMLGNMMGMDAPEDEDDEDSSKIKMDSKNDEDDNPAEAEGNKDSDDDENALDKTDDALNKANDAKDKVDGIINKTKGLFKRR